MQFAVPIPDVSILPFGSIADGLVGSPQEIHCTVSVVSGVELSSVMISWMGPGGNAIANDSRVTISPITSINNDYISTLEFTYLMEGDEGRYTCDVMILETNASKFIEIKTLTSKLVIQLILNYTFFIVVIFTIAVLLMWEFIFTNIIQYSYCMYEKYTD